MAKKYAPMMWWRNLCLYVRVVKARGLAVNGATRSSNPYVKLIIGSQSIQTLNIPKSLTSLWNVEFASGNEVLHGLSLRSHSGIKTPVRDPPDDPPSVVLIRRGIFVARQGDEAL
ncbi:hypothetical protein GOP47_0008941 [Adiantum capillus-veneris]|uniref:C2 domain-containing protein n=1 Tax=Adiantum capillus-veneris TaxID=13818 RepID=A0A9D4UZ97_ADICA|nr:hypothetical protein GOP47_0008941 [Adiantum capillus-veneris]